MSNRLAKEKSLYLKEHAENPVNWWPWCKEAFEEAKAHNKPIIVSIGYSSCHWCHVMARECFEDSYIADLMNKHFVCIKVDREERPDIDQIYMEAVQMITQRGGWPLNVFCFPDGKAFFGGTYFPAEDRGQGIIPWPQLLMRISEHFQRKQEELQENAENIVKNLEISNNFSKNDDNTWKNSIILTGSERICGIHDDEWGGFGPAPKFPQPMILDFLFAVRNSESCEKKTDLAQRIDEVLLKTLKAMAHGGIFDQIGGGFMRYSVDQYWAIPHFEKMLYDNGLLLGAYVKGWLRYREPIFKAVIEEIIGWLEREMELEGSVYAASIDADSEGEEGKFYVWSREEVLEVLGQENGRTFCDAYNITEKGNFEGKNNPVWVYDDPKKREALGLFRQKLLEVRDKRERPKRDSKVLLSWNSLVIKSLAEAGFYMGRPEWFKKAMEGLDWIWEKMRDQAGRLRSVYYGGADEKVIHGFLDDYVFYAEACLAVGSKAEWIKEGLAQKYISRAEAVVNEVLKHFKDKEEGGYYFTADNEEALVTRKKAWMENAMPTGNAGMIHCLSEIYAVTGNEEYEQELQSLREAYVEIASQMPNAVSYALSGFTADAVGVCILKVREGLDLEELAKGLRDKPYRKLYIIRDSYLKEDYQLCVGTQCTEPTGDVSTLLGKI